MTGVLCEERVIAEMQEGVIMGKCSEDMLTEYDTGS